MRSSADEIEFTSHALELVVAEMDALASGGDGRQWVNIVPDVDETQIHTGSVFFRVFSARGPVIPLGTWIPRHDSRQGEQAASVGIRHAAGRDVVARLAAAGAPVPEHWVVGQDHPKQGLIVYVHPRDGSAEVLDWLLPAMRSLAPFEFTDAWIARVHRA